MAVTYGFRYIVQKGHTPKNSVNMPPSADVLRKQDISYYPLSTQSLKKKNTAPDISDIWVDLCKLVWYTLCYRTGLPYEKEVTELASQKYNILYGRLSQEDDRLGESNSILN